MKSRTRVFSSRLNSYQVLPKLINLWRPRSISILIVAPIMFGIYNFDDCICWDKSAENISLLLVRFHFTFTVAAHLAMFSYHPLVIDTIFRSSLKYGAFGARLAMFSHHPLVIHTIFKYSLTYGAFGADYKFESLCPLSVH
nr:hypothetical protein Iba_chr11eCG8430 [Ipomoea batatas]